MWEWEPKGDTEQGTAWPSQRWHDNMDPYTGKLLKLPALLGLTMQTKLTLALQVQTLASHYSRRRWLAAAQGWTQLSALFHVWVAQGKQYEMQSHLIQIWSGGPPLYFAFGHTSGCLAPVYMPWSLWNGNRVKGMLPHLRYRLPHLLPQKRVNQKALFINAHTL